QLVSKYGYPVESHTVLTSDGYFLTLHRIPHGRHNATVYSGAVIVQHGVLSSSADWVILGPDKALGYVLADAGYDVWLGNARGNTYSRRHVKLTTGTEQFWDFSWHEMGVYDLPAVVDYIVNTTGEQRLFYVGHSMGTTMFYAFLSERPQYNGKIRAMFSLAPVAFSSHMTNPLRAFILTRGLEAFYVGHRNLGVMNVLSNSDPFVEIGRRACRDKSFAKAVCGNILLVLGGLGSSQINASDIPTILGHTPAGTSTKTFLHFAQLVKSGRFCQFDYGPDGNSRLYGDVKPPAYKLDNLKAPISLHYSDHDSLASHTDVLLLHKQLPNPIGYFRVPLREFNHLDFLWGKDVRTLVYDYILELMSKY
ncbi:hypothetical protein L798_07396, partial [Zootermopsis nevadensis]